MVKMVCKTKCMCSFQPSNFIQIYSGIRQDININLVLSLCMQGNSACSLCSADFFSFKNNIFKKNFESTIRVSNSSDPDQAYPGSNLFAKIIS